ncbi:hypothetical protein PMZ80_008612 [Knufia obscura]|uniref:NADPH-dependent 1-acyldihydroxyacetone phosphate reductase n=2 Tax=Knufia TaxID=430999 RepID=A0AAN8ECJ6_9EURO|nr:hypothetical protein PMZ80_008612 [Knufia obscura]KAK5952068.1 hypothetical protein OHC33_006955 [Knufia fluminis]
MPPPPKKIVLITGCSDDGLGSALALAFHRTSRYRVIATARSLSKLNDTRDAGIEELQLDVLSPSSISTCAKQLETLTGGKLDMLVNNAGAGYNMPVVDIDLDEARKVFDLNVWTLSTVSRAFLPFLLKTPGSKIVNNISIVAFTTPPVQGVYNASKAAANALNETMRLELKPFGIKVIALMTGSVKSRIMQNVEVKGVVLPEDSIYRVVPGGLTLMKDGGAVMAADAMDATIWASQVVGDLSKANPPHQIWRGSNAMLVRYGSLLPVGTFDSTLLKRTGFDEVERALAK